MGFLTREQILQADDLPRERVEVPEWGGAVWVRTLTGNERDAFEAESLTFPKKGESELNVDSFRRIRSRLCARAICDEKGKRLFTDEDAAVLGDKSAAALDRVYEVASRLSKISQKDVEELVKNSANGQGGDFSLSSPALLAAASANCLGA